MFGMIIEKIVLGVLCAAVLAGLPGCGAEGETAAEKQAPPDEITVGTTLQRGFVNDNVYHSEFGDIHYSSYFPDSYDGSEPYALFITLPGWGACTSRALGPIWRRISAPKRFPTTIK